MFWQREGHTDAGAQKEGTQDDSGYFVVERHLNNPASRALLERVVKLNCQASNRSISVVPAFAGTRKRLLSRNDLAVKTPGFRLSPE